MKNQNKAIFSNLELAEQFDSVQLLSEIIPLMKDYFVGDILFDDNQIAYTMPNGQTFLISARSI